MNIIVIGAAGGIGNQLVLDLADTSNLLLGYNSSKISLSAESQKVDGRDFESVFSFIQFGLEKYESIDAVVNLPGNLMLKPPHLCTEEDFYSVIEFLLVLVEVEKIVI